MPRFDGDISSSRIAEAFSGTALIPLIAGTPVELLLELRPVTVPCRISALTETRQWWLHDSLIGFDESDTSHVQPA